MSRRIPEYDVFQLSHSLVLEIYKITRQFPDEEKYGLGLQMRRSSSSIPMNLAEGGAREGSKEFRYFVNIAIGSCGEISYQLKLAYDLGYISKNDNDNLIDQYNIIVKMLMNLHKKLKSNS